MDGLQELLARCIAKHCALQRSILGVVELDLHRVLGAEQLVELGRDAVPDRAQLRAMLLGRTLARIQHPRLQLVAEARHGGETEERCVALERVDAPLHVGRIAVHRGDDRVHDELALGEELQEADAVLHDPLEDLEGVALLLLRAFAPDLVGDVRDHDQHLGDGSRFIAERAVREPIVRRRRPS